MEIAKILENKGKNRIYGLIGNISITTNNYNYGIVTDSYFKNTIKEYLNSDKSNSALKMVMLEDNYLYKSAHELTNSDLKKVNLAKILIENKDYIILDYFDKGLNKKEKENFRRILKFIANNYNKTIVIFTNDITFMWDILDELIIVDNNDVIHNISKQNIFNSLELIDKPEIIKFIELVKSKNIKIDYYKNTMDLLKAIYRIKGD